MAQFKELIKNHQNIFQLFFEAFHTYIWQVDYDGIPLIRKQSPFISGEGIIEENLNSTNPSRTKKYMIFIRRTVLVYNRKSSEHPVQIINLEGLSAEEVSKESLHGFTFKHRDGIYPESNYLFESKEVQQEWMKYLSMYLTNNIYN